MVLARRFTRLAARFLDGIIFVVLAIGFSGLAGFFSAESPEAINEMILALGGIGILGLVGVNLYLLATRGQTLGKMALRVRIVRPTGADVGLGRLLLLRFLPIQLASLVPVLGAILGLVNVLMIFGESRRCLHDYFADTVVVNA